jgi:hypothetical protein
MSLIAIYVCILSSCESQAVRSFHFLPRNQKAVPRQKFQRPIGKRHGWRELQRCLQDVSVLSCNLACFTFLCCLVPPPSSSYVSLLPTEPKNGSFSGVLTHVRAKQSASLSFTVQIALKDHDRSHFVDNFLAFFSADVGF